MWSELRVGMLLCAAVSTAALAQDARRSGFDDMGPDTQAMQKDDLANPGMLTALDGEALWNAPAGAAQASCASCHGDAKASMRGVAARYPAIDANGQAIDLAGRINQCRETRQRAPALARESGDLLALTTFVGLQSRGMPIAPPDDPRLDAVQAQGRALYTARMGQLNFSCAQCHDEHAGGHLGAAPIPQAHPTGYPLYRLEWQATGSLERRFRNCMVGMRAEPFSYGSAEYVALKAFLMDRARGMAVETPAVRP
jgi:sulfur-oxidizing protein SoxA